MDRINQEFALVREDTDTVTLFSFLVSVYYKVNRYDFRKMPNGDIYFELLKSKVSMDNTRSN